MLGVTGLLPEAFVFLSVSSNAVGFMYEYESGDQDGKTGLKRQDILLNPIGAEYEIVWVC